MANISKIKLPNGNAYKLVDAEAQQALGQLTNDIDTLKTTHFLTYKDNTHTEAQIKALTSAKVGDFYIASDTGTAWVCVTAINGTASDSSWEKAGSSTDVSKFVIAEDYSGSGTTTTVAETFDGHTIEEFSLKTDIVNNLTSTSTTAPLSAAQGKALNDNISAVKTTADSASTKAASLETTVSTLSSDNTTNKSNITSLTNNKLNKSGGTMTGALVAQNNTNYTTKQVRNIFISTDSPSGGSNGDIWIKYS